MVIHSTEHTSINEKESVTISWYNVRTNNPFKEIKLGEKYVVKLLSISDGTKFLWAKQVNQKQLLAE